MSSAASALLTYLGKQGSIETRLRETGEGDQEYFNSIIPSIPGLDPREEDLIILLHQLQQGALVRSETVHPYDSSEYIVTWNLPSATTE